MFVFQLGFKPQSVEQQLELGKYSGARLVNTADLAQIRAEVGAQRVAMGGFSLIYDAAKKTAMGWRDWYAIEILFRKFQL